MSNFTAMPEVKVWERGPGWGTHVHPWLIHVSVWQNPLPYCKVISLQLKEVTFFQKAVFSAFCPTVGSDEK